MKWIYKLLFLLALLPLGAHAQNGKANTFEVGKGTFLLNGKPFIVKAAELHYPRIPREYWEHRIKMCKALGMNTICLYVFWNLHEQEPGKFDFTGGNDVAAFCRLAQKHGMWVIVRPGPYVCAEWEMGGLPWWLLKKKDVKLRSLDPYFMECVERFETAVAEQLAPLTVDKGGPIIMVQVENEYGAYAADKPYISAIRDMLRKVGFDKVVLFQCDWSSTFEANALDDLVWTMNFGTGANIEEQFRRLGEVRPDAPKMCSEFWSGWFDKWGSAHETRGAKEMVDGIDQMLSRGISFSLYMTHGGTSFGHWAGGNSPWLMPDVTSYDYDAPINEYGHTTPKYFALRELLQRYADGQKLPAVPAPPAPLITLPEVTLTEYAPLASGVVRTETDAIRTFEALDMGFGSAIYSTTLPALDAPAVLQAEVHDFAVVYLNGKRVGVIDRTKSQNSLQIPACPAGTKLQLVVEGMGRINFGHGIYDYKGIVGQPRLELAAAGCRTVHEPLEWTMELIPDTYENALAAFRRQARSPLETRAGYYRGTFRLKRTGDTFLNTEAFGKGLVYINGHALGRFWSIGPQQTLYVPGCWLKKGENEIVVLDVIGPKAEPKVFGSDKPEWNKLNLTAADDITDAARRPNFSVLTPAHRGQFAPGNGWQKVSFGSAAKGRYLALCAAGGHDASTVSAIAEIYALGADGQRIDRNPWKAYYTDSQTGTRTVDKVFDLQESTFWQTAEGDALPHTIVIDLGSEQTLTGLEYLPRAEAGAPGSVKGYSIYVYN